MGPEGTMTTFADLEGLCRTDRPRAVLVLGSGMGGLAERIHKRLTLPFAAIPGLPAVSVAGHRGCLSLGEWQGRLLLLFEGRLHLYEGHPWDVVVRPLQVAADLGAPVACLTNAAGGIADALAPGSLMALTDHLEWTRPYAWRHPGPGMCGPARPSPYSQRLRELLRTAARDRGVELHEGVYAAVTGPCYETPAEIRGLRTCGADAVGMSTAREVQAAAERGVECAAISLITNKAAGLAGTPLNHEEVLVTAAQQATRLADLLERFLELL
jgi:purine-nucleoside phosphorylase